MIQDILLKLGIQDCYVYSSLGVAFGTDSSGSKRVIANYVFYWLFSILLLSNMLISQKLISQKLLQIE